MIKTLNIFFISIFLSIPNAQADFNKALEAYKRRNGDIIVAEVKEAVDSKNSDGLLLFLYAMNIDASISEYGDGKFPKTTLKSTLTKSQWIELRDLLTIATNSSTVQSQYYYKVKSQFSKELMTANLAELKINAKKSPAFSNQELNNYYALTKSNYANQGVADALNNLTNNSDESLIRLAELDDPTSQLSLGLKYLNFTSNSGLGCIKEFKQFCKVKDEAQGHLWLRRAAKSYETKSSSNLGMYADTMCEYFQSFQKPEEDHQAYLWCLLGVNSGGDLSYQLLTKMHETGKLKTASPKLNAVWSNIKKRNDLLHPNNLTELPDWIVEARKELAKERIPVFSYYVLNDPNNLSIEIYSDGEISIPISEYSNAELMKVSPSKVKEFLAELKLTGVNDWPLDNRLGFNCDNFCPPVRSYTITLREGSKTRRVYFNDINDHLLINPSNIKTIRIAKIYHLIEKHFPTQDLRCGLGNSEEYKRVCMNRNKKWLDISKEKS